MLNICYAGLHDLNSTARENNGNFLFKIYVQINIFRTEAKFSVISNAVLILILLIIEVKDGKHN